MGHGEIAEFIMMECSRGKGSGQLFLRRDGLENTPERIAARQDYLAKHPDTRREFQNAILDAGITIGMSREEVVAAWGLDEAERKSAYCRMTGTGTTSYYSYHGFKIGGVIYTLYVTDDTLTSISHQGMPDTQLFIEEGKDPSDDWS